MKVPEALWDLQNWMGGIIQRPLRRVDRLRIPIYDAKTVAEARERVKPGPQLRPEQRVGLYNQQVWYRFFKLLQDDFPLLVRLFGPQQFNRQIAEPYLRAHWPRHWSLLLLGRQLPAWVRNSYWEKDRRLVLGSAAIDEAHERIFFEPALRPLTAQEFGGKIFLQPRAVLFWLSADLFAFRREMVAAAPEAWFDKPFPPIAWGARRPFVLWGEGREVFYEEVAPAAYRILKAFQKGAYLEEVCAKVEGEVGEELSGWFQRWAARGWLTAEKK